jgi:hypothetical protein
MAARRDLIRGVSKVAACDMSVSPTGQFVLPSCDNLPHKARSAKVESGFAPGSRFKSKKSA